MVYEKRFIRHLKSRPIAIKLKSLYESNRRKKEVVEQSSIRLVCEYMVHEKRFIRHLKSRPIANNEKATNTCTSKLPPKYMNGGVILVHLQQSL
jgi:hypothetical protein